ncbi:MAG: hypothetical protein OES57_14720, partial [Acidimicrobiia bacterium]|nr:hypothetical protein [Acidimicrobiia bacterium]
DGRITVEVPASSIRFVRPRVDMERTTESVRVDKGAVGKLTDVFPWVEEGNGLTTAAYTYVQRVIGGSDCMQAAYSATSTMLRDAYRDQVLAQGGDPGAVQVRITGTPDFGSADPMVPDGVELDVSSAVTCTVLDGAGEPPVSSS